MCGHSCVTNARVVGYIAQRYDLMAIVAKTPDPELEWPRKECSILYRSGKTGINKDLKMKLVRSLVWTVLTYGAEGWTLKKSCREKDRISRNVDLSLDATSQFD